MTVEVQVPSILVAGGGELSAGLVKHLARIGVRAHESTAERALDHVWLAPPSLIVATGDALLDGGALLVGALCAEPKAAVTPLLLLRRGRYGHRLAQVAALTPTLGAQRLAVVIARLAHELVQSGFFSDAPLQQRVSRVLRQVEQEGALLLRGEYRRRPTLSSAPPGPADNLEFVAFESDETGAIPSTENSGAHLIARMHSCVPGRADQEGRGRSTTPPPHSKAQ